MHGILNSIVQSTFKFQEGAANGESQEKPAEEEEEEVEEEEVEE